MFIYLREHEALPGLSPLSEEQKGLRAIAPISPLILSLSWQIEAVTVHEMKASTTLAAV